jgi:[protein-PII] uridylyltransferase
MEDQVARHKKFRRQRLSARAEPEERLWRITRLSKSCFGLPISKRVRLSTNQLVGKDWLSESDQRRIERAYDFLLRLRTDLHYATGRATDILHMNLQDQIAMRLGYSPRRGQLRSEALMRDCYNHTRNILRVTERITNSS